MGVGTDAVCGSYTATSLRNPISASTVYSATSTRVSPPMAPRIERSSRIIISLIEVNTVNSYLLSDKGLMTVSSRSSEGPNRSVTVDWPTPRTRRTDNDNERSVTGC